MDSSFQTPPSDAHPSAATGQLIFSAENDQFIEDLFEPSSTGGRILLNPRSSPSLGPTPTTVISGRHAPLPPADPERLQAEFLVRVSAFAVSVAIDGFDIQDVSIQAFQRDTVDRFKDLLPATQDTALLPMLQIFFVDILLLHHHQSP